MPEYQNNADKAINAYEYRYDNRGRVVKKYLPQCGVIQYWYDKADRVAYMKDPALGNKYRFNLYDKFGRLCLQGTCSNVCKVDTTYATTAYQTGSSGLCNTGYAAPYTINSVQLETVNYYDNYSFIGKNFTTTMPTVSISEKQKQYAIGSQTGSVVYATNGEALGSINVYDIKGHVVRSLRKGLGGFTEDVSTAYTFTGDIEKTTADVNVKYGSSFTAITDYAYNYGKKTKMTLAVSHGMTPLSRATDYYYDAIGRLTGKSRYLTSSAKSNCSYSYDIHGWLTRISSGGFEECLYYADGLDGGCYNGNISTMKWKNGNTSYNGYNLKYDDSNRLSSCKF